MRLGNNKERSRLFFIKDTSESNPHNFVCDFMDFVFIFRHSSEHFSGNLLALLTSNKANHRYDWRGKIDLEDFNLFGFISLDDDLEHLQRKVRGCCSFGPFAA